MDQKQNGRAAVVIVGAQIFFFTLLVLATLRGIVLSIMWGWFIEPLGVPGLNVAEAVGICLIVGFLTPNVKPEPGKTIGQQMFETWGNVVTICVFALVFGFFFHLFV